MSRTRVIATVLLFATALSAISAFACNKQDRSALLALKNSFKDADLPWFEDTDCCGWLFVSCDNATGRVSSLFFEAASLNGSIPASVGDLPSLERLAFSRIPSLRGPIPPQLAKLKKLQSLLIYQTKVSGPIPPFLSQLPALEQLTLYRNRLSGTIPPSLGDLARLTDVNLAKNKLVGPIPASLFGKLPKGTPVSVDLSRNRLTGTVPPSFADVAFSYIWWNDNELTGDALFLFGKSKQLVVLDIARNRFAFDFGKAEFPEITDHVDISRNEIYGSIPDQLTELPSNLFLDVSHNQLCGKIPTGDNLARLPAKNFAFNKCLCGAPLQPCK